MIIPTQVGVRIEEPAIVFCWVDPVAEGFCNVYEGLPGSKAVCGIKGVVEDGVPAFEDVPVVAESVVVV